MLHARSALALILLAPLWTSLPTLAAPFAQEDSEKEGMEKFEVMEGKTTTVKLGGPFSFDFAFEEDEANLTLTGNTVVVVGAAGERYERPWGCVPRPDVSWRKKGTKKGSKGEKTQVISQNDQFSEYGWAAAWAPLDLVIAKKGKVDESELQLSEKKNKLFGKIESDWKE